MLSISWEMHLDSESWRRAGSVCMNPLTGLLVLGRAAAEAGLLDPREPAPLWLQSTDNANGGK